MLKEKTEKSRQCPNTSSSNKFSAESDQEDLFFRYHHLVFVLHPIQSCLDFSCTEFGIGIVFVQGRYDRVHVERLGVMSREDTL